MVVMEMTWKGITPELYEEVKRRVNWEANPSPGGHIHIAWFQDGSLRCLDVWESEQSFTEFGQNRLMPALAGLDVQHQPEIRYHVVHDTFVLGQAIPAMA